MSPLLYLSIGFTVFCLLAAIVVLLHSKTSSDHQRVMEVVNSGRSGAEEQNLQQQAGAKFAELAGSVRSRLGFGVNDKMKERFVSAGLRHSNTGDLFFAAQFLLPLVGVFGGSFIPTNTFFWILALAAVGYIAPDMWLTYQTKKRVSRIRRSIPDALDLLVICVDAGLGIDQALLRVGSELALSYPDIHDEFAQVNLEQRAGKPRLEAWQSLAERTKIEEFVSFSSMLIQSDRFGTPILKALMRFSDDLRTQRKQHAEEAAAKTKVKIIFPLVLFIFPCIFIVLLAPAIFSIASGMKAMGN